MSHSRSAVEAARETRLPLLLSLADGAGDRPGPIVKFLINEAGR